MRLRATAIAAALLACLLVGCGGSASRNVAQDGPTDAVGAYKEIAHNWKYNDFQNACPAMSAGYQHKLLAELELFSGDCRALVAEISKQLNGRDAIKDLSVTAVKGPTVAGSVLVRSKVSGGIVRDRYDFVRLNGQWVIAGDRNFDATGPHGPVKAYEKAEGGDPEILWSEVKGKAATVWDIKGNGHGSYTLWRHSMELVGGKWVLRRTAAVGTAPATNYKDSTTS